jgi:hypothetical protein
MASDEDSLDDENPGSWIGRHNTVSCGVLPLLQREKSVLMRNFYLTIFYSLSPIQIEKREEASNMFSVHDHHQRTVCLDFLKEENGAKTPPLWWQVQASTTS